jgi:hypothetical protein
MSVAGVAIADTLGNTAGVAAGRRSTLPAGVVKIRGLGAATRIEPPS